MAQRPDLEVVLCLRRLLEEAEAGQLRGLSYSTQTEHGLTAGWAGKFSGRRLTVVGNSRILAVDDPHGRVAQIHGVER